MKVYLYSLFFLSALILNVSGAEDETAKKQLNDAMAERAVIMVESHKIEKMLDLAWSDKEYTSPEIEKLRERYQKLKFEMIDVRTKLMAEVKKLPEIQAQVQKMADMRAKQEDLEKKIIKLQK